jgi:iron complex outermembrane recepter protein
MRDVGIRLLALAALFLTAGPASARQAGRDTTVIRLERLPVTVARSTAVLAKLPVAVTSVSASTIRDARSTVGLDESLARVPGVFVNNRYNFSLGTRISIRGLGARAAFGVRGIRVLSDGIPLTMPDGQTNLNNLELGTADRIDILRGPSSALYGNAAGGVISIVTEPAPTRFSSELRAFGGNAGVTGAGLDQFFKVQAKTGGPLGPGGFVASLSRMETDGYRAFSRAKQTLFNAVAREPIGDRSRLDLVVNLFDSPLAQSAGALPLDSVLRNPRMAWPNNVRTGSGEATQQFQAGAAFAQAFDRARLDIAIYALGRDVANALPYAWIDLSRRGGGTRATWAGSGFNGRLSATGGLDVEWMSDDRQEFNNDGGRRGNEMTKDQRDQVTTLAPFAQVQYAVGPRVDVQAGVRFDNSRFETDDRFVADGRDDSGARTLSKISPIVGLSAAVADGVRIYGNVATAFQTPTTTELINAPPVPGETCCPGGFNSNLDPQRAISFEVGARGSVGRFDLDVAAYQMKVDKTIVPYQVADIDGREFFRNAGESRHRGVELATTAHLGLHDLTLAWTLNDFVFIDDGDPAVDNEGNQLPGVPRNHLWAGLRLVPASKLQVDLEVDRTGGYFANDANDATARNDAATVVDLRLLYSVHLGGSGFRPFLAIANATDTRYNSSVVVNAVGRRYYEPAPRRSVQIGMSLATGGWSAR